ncbi:MAG: hypothetical protein JRM80_13215 [Nitrososphaerota archaeon]|nr:hypothetical protein [Nitrososphaerota archaeon]
MSQKGLLLGSRPVRGTGALAVAVLLVATAFLPAASAQVSSGSSGLTPTQAHSLRINSRFFVSTVPAGVWVGENFSVHVQITNVSNQSIPAITEVSTPPTLLYVVPHVIKGSIAPGATVDDVFWVVPLQQTNQPQNVTAKVWIWFADNMTSPALVSQTSATVLGVGPSPLAPYLALGVAAVAAGVVGVILLVRRRAGRKG